MAFPEWAKSRYLVGHPTLDQQHEELFAQMNRLLEAMSVGEGRKEVHSLLVFLEQYVEDHFKTEESLIADPESPMAKRNVQDHQELAKRFFEMKEIFNREGPSSQLAIQIQKEIADWLEQHIKNVDVKLQLRSM